MRRLGSLVLGLVCWLVLSAPAAAEQFRGFAPEDRVGNYLAQGVDGSGVATVVWSQTIGLDASSSVMGRRVAANGTPLGAPVQLSPAAGRPLVGVDAAGDAIVVWITANETLQGERWAAGGTIGPVQTLAQGVTGGDVNADLVVSGGGSPTATVVWQTSDPSSATQSGPSGAQWPIGANSPGAAQSLSGAGENVSDFSAAASSTSATVMWTVAPTGQFAGTLESRRWPIGAAPGSEQQVTAAGETTGGGAVGADASGDAVFGWKNASGVRVARWPSAAGSPSAPVTVSATGGPPGVAVAPAGGATLVWKTSNGAAVDLSEAQFSAAGVVGTEHTLPGAAGSTLLDTSGNVNLVVDSTGVTTIVFGVSGPVAQLDGVRVAANGTLGSVQTLTNQFTSYKSVDVAVAPGGAVRTVWARPLTCDGDIRAGVWAAGAGAPSAGQIVSTPDDAVDGASVAGTQAGNADVVDSHCAGGTARAELRFWPAGGGLGSPVPLTPAGSDVELYPQVAVDAGGEATVVWTQLSGTELQLAGVRVSPTGAVGAVQILAQGNANPTGAVVSVTPSGDATVVWNQWNGTQLTVYGARWPASGSPSAPVAISANDESAAREDGFPVVAVDPSGNATIVWTPGDLFLAGDYAISGNSLSLSGTAEARRWTASGTLSPIAKLAAAFVPEADVVSATGGAAIIGLAGSGLQLQGQDWPAGASAPGPLFTVGGGYGAGAAFDQAGDLFVSGPAASPGGGSGTDAGLYVRPAAGSSFAGPQDLSAAGAAVAELAVDAGGDAAVLARISTSDANNDSLQARVRLSDGTVCANQTLGLEGSDIDEASVAMSAGASGAAVWESFNGSNQELQSARFGSGCPALSVSTAGAGSDAAHASGRVSTDSGGISCARVNAVDNQGSCAHSYAPAKVVRLTATPDASSTAALRGACTTPAGAVGQAVSCSVTVNAAASETATFDRVARSQSTTVSFENQKITLTTPSLGLCSTRGKTLEVSLSSTTIPGSKATKLHFATAAFYLDKGVKHTHAKTVLTRKGKKKKVIVITYSANATAHHVPVAFKLKIAGLKAGSRTLTVKMSYKETKKKHGHKVTVRVTKTVRAKFNVC